MEKRMWNKTHINSTWNDLKDIIGESGEIIIFGASSAAETAMVCLEQNNIDCHIKYFIDNDVNKSIFCGYPVYRPEILKTEHEVKCVLIASCYYEEMAIQLQELDNLSES
ncbi:MAG: hypothetical protein ACI4A3_08200 [Lachnospiraceae bacterium]